MASVEHCVENLIDRLSRDIISLKNEDRQIRKRALEIIEKETVRNYKQVTEDDYQSFVEYAYKSLLHCLSDRVEKCREIAASILLAYFSYIPCPKELLPYTVPVLVQRLGTKELVESSEEVRLIEVQTLNVIIQRCKDALSMYVNEFIAILSHTIVDPYPEIKKASCSCVCILARSTPHFHMQAQSLINPLLKTVSHQHHKVRTVCVSALGTVVLNGSSKILDDVVPHLAQRLFDQSSSVRLAVTTVVGQWLVELPDRYSFFYKLIPLLLSSLADDVQEIRDVGAKLWENAGEQYLKENEKDYKDEIDFPKPPPTSYPQDEIQPSFGCRMLVQRHLSYILPAVLNDLEDWLPATRVKSVHLLYLLLLHAEDNITMNLQNVLTGLVQAAVDEEKEVIGKIEKSGEMIGCFISPDIWRDLILPIVTAKPDANALRILASVMRGTDAIILKSTLSPLCSVLAEPDVCRTTQLSTCEQLLCCVEIMLDTCGSTCKDVSFSLFTIVVTCQGMMENPEVANRVHIALTKLASANSCSVQDIYKLHANSLLQQIQPSHHLWTALSPQLHIFCSLLTNIDNIGVIADVAVPMIVTNLQPSIEPELKLQLFILLSSLFNKLSEDSLKQFSKHIPILIEAAIMPNLVWRAGRTAAAIQTTAVSCLWTCVKHGYVTKPMIKPMASQLLTQLISLLDSDAVNTRLMTCKVMEHMLPLMAESVDSKQIHDVYPDLLKCMDDVSNDVRLITTKVFHVYFKSFEEDCDWTLYKYHLQAIYKGLLVHMDDCNKHIRETVLGLLKDIACFNPQLLLEEIQLVQHKHKDPILCTELIEHTEELTIKD